MGRLDYDPSMPWAYKIRLDDGNIAADFVLYIDDARPAGATEEMCWLATRRFTCVFNHFGIQDTPRKRPLHILGPARGQVRRCTPTMVGIP
jgi:hypothetical protein